MLNWEFSATDQRRGYSGGVVDAREAYRQARILVPDTSIPLAIYFSADWDASLADFNNYIRPYLQGAGSVLGGPRYIGIYGSYYTVKRSLEAGVAHYGWQTYAWSGGQWYAPAQVRQTQNGLGGGQYDLDYSYADDFGYVGSISAVPDPAPVPGPEPTIPINLPAALVAATTRTE